MSLLMSYAAPDLGLAAAAGTPYTLKLINQSAQPWTFYVYQKLPGQVADVFSLAWFASPYKISVGDSIKFKWEITYNFVWSDSGVLIPGVTFDAGGTKDADPNNDNVTTFSLNPGPNLSTPVKESPSGSLIIKDADDVPNNKFSVGIGMSGTGTYAVQAGTGLRHTFTPTPSYWVAAGTNVQIGTVLNIQTVTQTAEAKFPSAVYSLVGTLGENNKWKIDPA
jgi:hypothetical protein